MSFGLGEIDGIPEPIDNVVVEDRVAWLQGLTAKRHRDTDVGGLLSIVGDDLYGAFPDGIPAGRYNSYDSQLNSGRDATHRMAGIDLDGSFSDIGYSCDGQITDALGLEFEFDASGRLSSVDNGTQVLERYYYDGLGRLAA